MNTPVRGGIATIVAACTLSACGATYVETASTTASENVPLVTAAPIAADAPVEELLAEIETLLFDLDERISTGNRPAETLARIEALWDVAEPQIRDVAVDAVRPFEVALDLARSGVAHKRPADASKGYKLIQQVIEAYG